MKFFKYSTFALAMVLSSSMTLAQDSNNQNSGNAGAANAPNASSSEGTGQRVDCPAAGTVSEDALPAECKTAAGNTTSTDATAATGTSGMTMSEADCNAAMMKADTNSDGSLGGDEAAPYLKKLSETDTKANDAMILDKTAFMEACMKGQFQGMDQL